MAADRPNLVRFGLFEVDFGTRELRKRGVRLKLQEQPFRVLEALLERAGQIVTREELKERLWAQDEFVEFDKSLNTSVQKIRQALDDSATSPRFLETVPKVGYRFVAPVEAAAGELAQEAPPPPPPKPRVLPYALAALAAAVVAVAGWELLRDTGPEEPAALPLRKFSFTPDGPIRRPVVSPDGRRIAYWQGTAAPYQLMVQDLDAEEPRKIEGAHGTVAFWTRDSRSITFSRDGERFVIVESAGDPQPPSIRVVRNWFEEFRDRE